MILRVFCKKNLYTMPHTIDEACTILHQNTKGINTIAYSFQRTNEKEFLLLPRNEFSMYHNSFAPEITAAFVEGEKTNLQLVFQPVRVVRIIISVLLVAWLLFGLLVGIWCFDSSKINIGLMAVMLLVPCVFMLFCWCGFYITYRFVERKLKTLLELADI